MSDPAWLASLHARCFTVPRPFTAPEFAQLLSAPTVFLSAHPNGFALGRLAAGEAELVTIAVDPHHRRQGTARDLLADHLRRARSGGAEHAFLEVDATNAAARALYFEVGYRDVGRRPGYYKPRGEPARDAVVMRMAL